MPITNRDLPAGTTLTATFKKTVYNCEVVAGEDGKTRYRYAGKEYTSPSAAGSAVMGGVSCNGWRFWQVEGGEPEGTTPTPAPKRQKAAKVAKREAKRVRKVPNQKGVEAGMARWHCSACMKGFVLPEGETPASCPEGHPREVEEELAAVS